MKKQLRVAYMMSRFPKLTETFILFEMIAVERQGVEISLYPLIRETPKVVHPEAVSFVERANYTPFLSPAVLKSNLHYLFTMPGKYLGTLWSSIRATWGSRRYLMGILIFYPKIMHIAHQMSEAGIDHIHAHFASHPAAAAYIIHSMTGIDYTFTAHGSDLHRDQHMLCLKAEHAAKVVTISQYNKNVFTDACGKHIEDKVEIIHCGVNLDLFRPEGDDSVKNGQFEMICVGSLHEVKGQTYLVEACRLLKEQGLTFVCHLVGSGEDREKLESMVELHGMQDYVQFHGQLPHSRVAELIRQMDIMVLPSVPTADGRREGIPVALMEGMASGLPAVSSRLSGIPELVEDGVSGILVEPGDVEGIAEAIAKLYHDPELRDSYGQAGRQKVFDEFELTTNAVKLISLFDQTDEHTGIQATIL